ncbi:YgjP-like metallopeptidase domain-containing protein [Streptomyces sp. NPDC003016]
MLLRFRTANVRSLRDEQELTFVAPGDEPSAAARCVELAGGEVGVLPLVGIFGANASGKSNVLAAMTDMSGAVQNSYARWASYDGTDRRLTIDEERAGEAPVRLVAGRLVLSATQAAESALGRAALTAWYCRAGRRWALGRLQPWAARMGVPEPALDVSDLGGRWGSYRPGPDNREKGRMSLGRPLFQLPMHLVDYVVAHELAHVRIHGHGPDFWALLGRALPEYEERKAELDELGRRMWMGDIA